MMMADDDFNVDDFDTGEDSFDDFEGGNTLGDAVKNNPLLKIGIVVVVLVVVVGGLFIFAGGDKKEDPTDSKVASTPDLNPDLANPNVELPTEYRRVFEQANQEQANRTLQQREGAFVPPPIFEDDQFEDPLAALEEEIEVPQADPLEIFRQQQEQIQREIQQEVQQQQIQQQQQLEIERQQFIQEQQQFTQEVEQTFSIQPDPASVQALSQAMLDQMNNVLGGVSVGPVSTLSVTTPASPEDLQGQVASAQGGFGQNNLGAGAPGAPGDESVDDLINQSLNVQEVVIEAGSMNFAQIINEVSTDAPTPILATLLSGPLRGGRLIGNFNTAPTQQNVIIQFRTIVKDGVVYNANSFAVDPNTSSPALATDFDRRIFRRVLLPAAAQFIQGIAGAFAQDNQAVVTVGDDVVTTQQNNLDFGQEFASGVEQGAQELGQFLQTEGDRLPPLIRVAPGTPIGVIYVDNVIEGQQQGQNILAPTAQQQPALPQATNALPAAGAAALSNLPPLPPVNGAGGLQ